MQYFKHCQHCHRDFTTHHRNAKYCAETCRMKAAHQRRKAEDRPGMTTDQKRRDTMLNTTITVTCHHCGNHYETNLLTGKGRHYCSNACKQAAYRARKANRATATQDHDDPTITLTSHGWTPLIDFPGVWSITKRNTLYYLEIQPALIPGLTPLYNWYKAGSHYNHQHETLSDALHNFKANTH